MTPAALVEMYSGEIPTGSFAYHLVVGDLRDMPDAEVRQVERLAPALSRLARLASVEIERRASARAARRIGRAMAAAVVMPARTTRREEW